MLKQDSVELCMTGENIGSMFYCDWPQTHKSVCMCLCVCLSAHQCVCVYVCECMCLCV